MKNNLKIMALSIFSLYPLLALAMESTTSAIDTNFIILPSGRILRIETPVPKGKIEHTAEKEIEFLQAVNAKSVAKIKQLLESRSIDPDGTISTAVEGLAFVRKDPLLEVAWTHSPAESKLEIMQLLIQQGADPNVLYNFLRFHTSEGDVADVQMLCSLGVRDTEARALAIARAYVRDLEDAAAKLPYQQIIDLLEKCK